MCKFKSYFSRLQNLPADVTFTENVYEFYLLVTYGLFNDAVHSSGSMASYVRMISEQGTGRAVE
jgi:hypothetical protein